MPSTELKEGQKWSWSVTFADPSGETKNLTHEFVLQGLRGLIYGDEKQTGVDSIHQPHAKQQRHLAHLPARPVRASDLPHR
jgi:hypothetical protein